SSTPFIFRLFLISFISTYSPLCTPKLCSLLLVTLPFALQTTFFFQPPPWFRNETASCAIRLGRNCMHSFRKDEDGNCSQQNNVNPPLEKKAQNRYLGFTEETAKLQAGE
ncbi:hypothetical protein MTR67_020310, partial [Solanum verrucosum]